MGKYARLKAILPRWSRRPIRRHDTYRVLIITFHSFVRMGYKYRRVSMTINFLTPFFFSFSKSCTRIFFQEDKCFSTLLFWKKLFNTLSNIHLSTTSQLISRFKVYKSFAPSQIAFPQNFFPLFSWLTPCRESRGPVYRPHRVRCNVLWLSASEHARRRVNAFNGG